MHPLGTPRGLDWGIAIDHPARRSSIVIKEITPEAGPDDHGLVGVLPPLKQLAVLLRYLEQRFAIHLQRGSAVVETTIAGGRAGHPCVGRVALM